ncbi:MAG TPA: hypothetical protein VHY10_02335 [Xanthobacteraceae bacterium]|jgi:4,5-dihydroxyphthalate decarboxylase|nr:hypothetical protein [Xanthobacteraceae bacterium]
MPRRITLALERYDRHLPFQLGQLDVPKEYDLVPLEVGMVPGRRNGEDRHGRMLKGNEFDAAETSLASYIIARSRGAPFTAIPVFPRRLFSQNHYFVAENAPYRTPSDLKGKRVIFWAFQVTMSVLAKGDWKRNYGLDWRDVEILTLRPEELSFPGLPITRLAPTPIRLKCCEAATRICMSTRTRRREPSRATTESVVYSPIRLQSVAVISRHMAITRSCI